MNDLRIPLRSHVRFSFPDPDALVLFSAMSEEPTNARKILISDTILNLKEANIWEKLDEIWFFAAHTQSDALLGWKRYKDCLAVSSPTFTEDEGFTGNGSSSYLNTQFAPATDGVQYTLNDANFGVYSRIHASANGYCDMGARISASSNRSDLFSRNAAGQTAYSINADGGTTGPHTFTTQGLWAVRRSASNLVEVIRNGEVILSDTTASTSLGSLPFFIGAINENGSAGSFTTRQYSFAFVGSGLTHQQEVDLFWIVENYMDSIGAGVI